ncbi:MAG: hypothetical protein IAE94_15930 [Chthoniobacterales bacterium]|nr:hypothetical protein [Chthoniobacterales bacterium]
MLTITEKEGKCTVSREGCLVFECPVSFDPGRTLDLLRTINSLQADDGTPIYAKYRIHKTPVWALMQEQLFWTYLQPLVKYRPVIDWLAEHADEPVEISIEGIAIWHRLIKKSSDRQSPCAEWRDRLEILFLCVNAAICGLFGFLSGARVMLWSLNCRWGERWIDYRLKDIYSILWEKKVPFIEGFPFPGFKVAFQRFFGSKRIVFYAPNILKITSAARQGTQNVKYDFSRSPDLPENLIGPLIERFESYVANAGLQARLLEKLLRLGGFRQIIGIDEHTSYAAILCAARHLNLEMIGLQHGVFHKYSIGWCTPGIPHEYTGGYGRIIVWGTFWRTLLAELSSTYTEDRLEVGGFIRPSTINLRPQTRRQKCAPFTILLPYEFLANAEEIADYVHAFHKRGYKVLFKVRFDDTLDQQLAMLPREKLELVPELTQEIIDAIHVCAGTSTTMMYELLHLGVPAWFIETRHDSNIHMVEKGIASRITLEMLEDEAFDPWQHMIFPSQDDSLFTLGGMPEKVLSLMRTTE